MGDSNSDFDDRLRDFLVQVIEVSEKIQFLLSHHDSEEDEEATGLYDERRALFEQAEADIASWIKQNGLSPSEPWNTYKEFMLLLEEDQDRSRYQASNKGLSLDSEVKLEDNPFLLQQENISDKEVVDKMILEQRMAKKKRTKKPDTD